MRVVLDTNVLVAAFAARGLCEGVFQVCLASHEIVLCEHILEELRRSLTGKLKLSVEEADLMASFVREQAEIVEPVLLPRDACRDRADLPVLGTALGGRADCLVTGDHQLLGLGRFRGIPILSPRAFHDSLG